MKKILILLIVPLLSFSQSIQEQIDEAEEGAILNISEGTYSESISINKSITLNCNSDCVIDASGLETAIYIEASNVSIDGFEIIGNDLTTSGIIITPICSGINISNNIIHGMSLPNQSNTSPLSYAILTYGSSETEFPTDLNFVNNYIYDVAGSGISLGSFTGVVTISDNTIENLVSVELLGEDFNVGIQAEASQSLIVENNNFSNLIIGSNLIFTTATIINNNYTDVISFLSHTTLAPVSFEEEVEWWSVEGTVEYLGIDYDITSYFSSLEYAMSVSAENGAIISDSEGNIYGCTIAIVNLTEICNYNPEATIDDGSCALPGDECQLDDGNIGLYNDFCECIEYSSSINEFLESKNLIKTVNILGQKSIQTDFYIEIYDDGSVVKKYIIKKH